MRSATGAYRGQVGFHKFQFGKPNRPTGIICHCPPKGSLPQGEHANCMDACATLNSGSVANPNPNGQSMRSATGKPFLCHCGCTGTYDPSVYGSAIDCSCCYEKKARLTASPMRSASGEKSLDFQGAAVNVLAVTAIGAVVGALVSKKNKVQSAQIGGGIGLILGIFGGFQVLKTSIDNSKA